MSPSFLLSLSLSSFSSSPCVGSLVGFCFFVLFVFVLLKSFLCFLFFKIKTILRQCPPRWPGSALEFRDSSFMKDSILKSRPSLNSRWMYYEPTELNSSLSTSRKRSLICILLFLTRYQKKKKKKGKFIFSPARLFVC